MKKIVFGMIVLGIMLIVSDNTMAQRKCSPPVDGVTIFVDDNYKGGCINYSFGNFPDLRNMNNKASSILVGRNVNAILCTEKNFGGFCQRFTGNDTWLGNDRIGNDRVSSLRIERKRRPASNNNTFRSIYRELNPQNCRLRGGDGHVGSTFDCPSGIAGNKVALYGINGPIKEGLSITTANGKTFSLKLYEALREYNRTGFVYKIADGAKAEYRTNNRLARANAGGLIFRVNLEHNDGEKLSNLVVVKLTRNRACITNIVEPKKGQNVRARQLADKAFQVQCLVN